MTTTAAGPLDDAGLADVLHQPWHRDVPMPDPTSQDGSLTSLAVNATTAVTRAHRTRCA